MIPRVGIFVVISVSACLLKTVDLLYDGGEEGFIKDH